MKLVIAEKPSVAMSLAAVLGATERKDGYLEGSGYLVSWCVGHLLELAQPEAYKEQYAKWRYEDLPILPENWKYEVPKDKKTQLALLCRLMKDKRVDSVVCATDAGREGELIFRLVYEYAGCKKPMERLWISSMEDAAIREGFDHLHPGSDYDKLYDAAVCRAGADWLIGINATRLFSVLYGVTLNVGRVMSPTLALLVQRESDIESFISKPFYVPEITCGGFTASGEKMTERSEAEKIRMDCDHNSAFVRSVEKQVKTVQPPRLYDLTTLQRECNRIFGYTAQQTLDYVPPYGSGATLYIRPYMFGTNAVIGVKPADEYQFRVFTTPVGPYFKGGAKPITVRISDFDRAAPHGTGHIKAGLNYAMSLHAIVDAHKQGFAENIYLDSATRTKIEETGGANILFVTKDNKVVTPKSNSILPSITRRSLMVVAKEYLGLEVEEREVYLDEVKDFAECGLCGTAAVISPVGKINDHGKEICFPSGMEEMGPVTKKLYETLTGIQMGRLEAPEGWIKVIE